MALIRKCFIVTNRQKQQKEFHPDAAENTLDKVLEPKGKECTLTCYVDADHAHDQLNRRSVSGIILLFSNTPVSWVSKNQKTVETSTYDVELVASRIAVQMMISMRYC